MFIYNMVDQNCSNMKELILRVCERV